MGSVQTAGGSRNRWSRPRGSRVPSGLWGWRTHHLLSQLLLWVCRCPSDAGSPEPNGRPAASSSPCLSHQETTDPLPSCSCTPRNGLGALTAACPLRPTCRAEMPRPVDSRGPSSQMEMWLFSLISDAEVFSRSGAQDVFSPPCSSSLIQKVRAENVFIRCLASRGPRNSGQGKQDRFRVVGASVSFHRNVAPMHSSYQGVSRMSNTERRKASEIRYSNDNTHWPLT